MPLALYRAALGTGFLFAMTTLGAATVFFFAREPEPRFQKALLGFAAGIMTAASVWSLLLPAIEQAEGLGLPGCLPACAGMLAGCVFLAGLDALLPYLRRDGLETQSALLMAAITLHNIPEGMAVGLACAMASGGLSGAASVSAAGTAAGTLTAGTVAAGTVAAGTVAGTLTAGTVAGTLTAGTVAGTLTAGTVAAGTVAAGAVAGTLTAGTVAGTSAAGAAALALGIGVQNFPEGAAVSLPLRGAGRGRAFLYGTLSGAVEPVFGLLAAGAAGTVSLMPWLLSFAAGAMLYVVADELIPQAQSRAGTCGYLAGFLLMMALDTALG